MELLNVSAVIVTRGDVDLEPIANGLPSEWELLVWDNGAGQLWGNRIRTNPIPVSDLTVYGRYAAIEYATGDLIYVQDDDCVVSDPQEIVDEWYSNRGYTSAWAFVDRGARAFADHVVCNMPPEFRHEFYEEHALVGFGSCFHRDAPQRAFNRLGLTALPGSMVPDIDFFYRTCDIVFTALTPRVLVDVPVTNLWWAENHTRMWRQENHVQERVRMLDLVKKVRDEG